MLKQSGITLTGFLAFSIIFIFALVLGFRVVPSYLEYYTIKKNLAAIKNELPSGSPSEIRRAFDRRAQIDDITAVTGQDLDISRDSVSVSYSKKVPLFSNISLYFDFEAGN
jgi:hypothetical protein